MTLEKLFKKYKIIKVFNFCLYFLLSIFLSWQIFQGLDIFLFLNKTNFNIRNLYFIWAVICFVLERPILKKLLIGNDLKTYFGLAYPFQTIQILSVLIGLFITLSLRTYGNSPSW